MRARAKLDVKFLRESAGLEWVWCGFGVFVLVFFPFFPSPFPSDASPRHFTLCGG